MVMEYTPIYSNVSNHQKEERSGQVRTQSQVSRRLVSELSGSPSSVPDDGI